MTSVIVRQSEKANLPLILNLQFQSIKLKISNLKETDPLSLMCYLLDVLHFVGLYDSKAEAINRATVTTNGRWDIYSLNQSVRQELWTLIDRVSIDKFE